MNLSVETVTPVKGLTLTMWDLGGQEKIRQLWKYYVDGIDAIIFMIDSADKERFNEARDELMRMLNFQTLGDVPLLIYCNKRDLPGAEKVENIVQAIGLSSMRRVWHCQSSNCLTGEGVYEGMQKLQGMIKEYRQKNGGGR